MGPALVEPGDRDLGRVRADAHVRDRCRDTFPQRPEHGGGDQGCRPPVTGQEEPRGHPLLEALRPPSEVAVSSSPRTSSRVSGPSGGRNLQHRGVVPGHRVAARDVLRRRVRGAAARTSDISCRPAPDQVDDQDQSGPAGRPATGGGGPDRQPPVAVVLGVDDAAARSTACTVDRACLVHRNGPPVTDWSSSVHRDRGVAPRAAVRPTPVRVSVVAPGTRVPDQLGTIDAQRDGERVSVPVRGDRQIAERTDVHHDRGARRAQHDQPPCGAYRLSGARPKDLGARRSLRSWPSHARGQARAVRRWSPVKGATARWSRTVADRLRVEPQREAFVVVAVAGQPDRFRRQGRPGSGHCVEPLRPSRRADRSPRSRSSADRVQQVGGEHLVADGLLGAGAVGQELAVGLARQSRRSPARSQRRRAGQLGNKMRDRRQAGELTDQVVVGGAEPGTVAPAAPRARPAWGRSARYRSTVSAGDVPQTLQRHRDRDRTGSPLRKHRARRSAARRVLRQPRVQLGERRLAVAIIAGQQPRLGQPRKMLEPIELPDPLRVTRLLRWSMRGAPRRATGRRSRDRGASRPRESSVVVAQPKKTMVPRRGSLGRLDERTDRLGMGLLDGGSPQGVDEHRTIDGPRKRVEHVEIWVSRHAFLHTRVSAARTVRREPEPTSPWMLCGYGPRSSTHRALSPVELARPVGDTRHWPDGPRALTRARPWRPGRGTRARAPTGDDLSIQMFHAGAQASAATVRRTPDAVHLNLGTAHRQRAPRLCLCGRSPAHTASATARNCLLARSEQALGARG